jgi:hypothetical protein
MVRSVLFGAAALALTVMAAPAAERDINSANFVMQGCRKLVDDTPVRDAVSLYCSGVVGGIAYMGFMVWAAEQAVRSRTTTPALPPDLFPPAPGSDAMVAAFMRRELCMDIPDGVATGQMVRVVVSYIDARPARMHEPFKGLALEALRAAWPCK